MLPNNSIAHKLWVRAIELYQVRLALNVQWRVNEGTWVRVRRRFIEYQAAVNNELA